MDYRLFTNAKSSIILLAVPAMPVSNHLIRRYTPPTCTLSVLGQNSALSRWMGKPALKQLSFELHFDDPRLPEEQRLIIRGNHDQLEALCIAVTNYVQELLQKSPEKFWVISQAKESSIASDASQTQDFNDSSRQTHILDSYSTQIQGSEIHIQPSNRLTHDLFIGSLATKASGDVIQLSLLQLFDLATALDEYSADVVALPNLNPEGSVRSLPAWVPIAAVLVLAVGLTPVTWQYANSIRKKPQTAKKPTPASEKIALQPSPSPYLPPLPTPSPLLTPPDSLLSSLPPRPPLGSTMPLLGSPVPLTAQSSPSSNFPTTLRTSPKTNPLTRQKYPNLTVPKASVPSTGSTTLTIPETMAQIPSSKKTTPFALESSQSLEPNFRQSSTGLISKQSPKSFQPNFRQNGTGSISQGGIPLPPTGMPSNDLPTTNSTSPDATKVYPPLATVPDLSSSGSTKNPNLQTDPSVSSANSLVARLRGTRHNTSKEVATGTLFDTAQISEARTFLKKRWQPPNQLKQTLEYSLVVGVDGTIEQILPLGKAARDYIDRTGMPLIGERFVSPNKSGQAVRIRAVFGPDGKVQTFPEAQ